MSGNTLLKFCYDYEPASGCSEDESRVCHQLVCTLVRSGAGVLAGVKPAALFSLDLRACERACVGCSGCKGASNIANEALVSLGYALREYGFGIVVFWCSRERVMLLLYRDRAVEELLSDAGRCAFLQEHGYETSSAAALIGSFSQRLDRYYASRRQRKDVRTNGGAKAVDELPAFPHEMGVLFGYPLEDVVGFMHNATPTCRGPWLAYGSADAALRQFDSILRAENACRREFEQGLSLGELARACVA